MNVKKAYVIMDSDNVLQLFQTLLQQSVVCHQHISGTMYLFMSDEEKVSQLR